MRQAPARCATASDAHRPRRCGSAACGTPSPAHATSVASVIAAKGRHAVDSGTSHASTPGQLVAQRLQQREHHHDRAEGPQHRTRARCCGGARAPRAPAATVGHAGRRRHQRQQTEGNPRVLAGRRAHEHGRDQRRWDRGHAAEDSGQVTIRRQLRAPGSRAAQQDQQPHEEHLRPRARCAPAARARRPRGPVTSRPALVATSSSSSAGPPGKPETRGPAC
jgi:hypothetical protein